jgi:D-alanine-D-alanine ligase
LSFANGPTELDRPLGRFIIKAVWEHASLGIAAGSVVDAAGAEPLRALLEQREQQMNRPCFAEEFIDGREFNLSLLAGASREPQVLPVAEIDFSAFPPGKPRIVDHLAKWSQSSFEYRQTPRRFDFPPADARLLEDLRQLARRCWNLFGMRGYARVDFRVDGAGQPWILEINANPCLSPDAGFAAAVEQAHLTYDQAIARILLDALA